MARFLLTRLGLAAITLFLLSVLVFVGANLLPGNVARRKLGNLADQSAVDQLNHKLGTDKPILVQYWNWISDLLHGDLGTSLSYNLPVSELVGPALLHSLKLAAFAFVMVVPLAILGGVGAALKRDKLTDRIITVGGLSLAVVPEFVTGIMLILVFGLWLDLLPVSANAPDGSNILTQLKYLFLPALTLVSCFSPFAARPLFTSCARADIRSGLHFVFVEASVVVLVTPGVDACAARRAVLASFFFVQFQQ